MFLPNRKKAYVPNKKLTGYLLSREHPIGKSKARFFNKHGFIRENANLLKEKLLTIAHNEFVVDVQKTPYGTKYAVDGFLGTNLHEKVKIRTIWILDKNENMPRLITVYPV